MESLPAACTLTSEAGSERRRVWQALADHALIEQVETERGVRLSYRTTTGVEAKLRELVILEAECCAFAERRPSRCSRRTRWTRRSASTRPWDSSSQADDRPQAGGRSPPRIG